MRNIERLASPTISGANRANLTSNSSISSRIRRFTTPSHSARGDPRHPDVQLLDQLEHRAFHDRFILGAPRLEPRPLVMTLETAQERQRRRRKPGHLPPVALCSGAYAV